jgi:uncharacterized protein (TIRG00374 family)
MSAPAVNIKRAVFSLVFITLAYIAVLLIIDLKKNIFDELLTLSSILPVAMTISLLSYVFRYGRWHWLLKRAGHTLPVVPGFLAYLSGFALTATPGKIGELLRIRYFSRLGVRHQPVISAFIYERAFDLIVVLLIALLAAVQLGVFPLISSFVLLVIATVYLFSRNPSWLVYITAKLRSYHFRKLSKLVKALKDGLQGIHQWLNLPDICVAFALGLIAWLLASFAFVWLLNNLGLDIPAISAIAIYPISMLIGAASMLPGGVGSTEAAIVVLLAAFDTPLTIATVAAIGIRISSLWFSIICGLLAMLILEYKNIRNTHR